MGVFPFQGKTHVVKPGIELGTSWLVVRGSDHQATRLVEPKKLKNKKHSVFDVSRTVIKWFKGHERIFLVAYHLRNPTKINKGSILSPSLFIRWKFYRWRTTSGCDVKFAVGDVKLDFGFDPKPVWSFTALRHLENKGQYFLSLRARLVRYSIL